MPFTRITDFMRHEAMGGLVLMATALLALLCANHPVSHAVYQQLTIPVVKFIVNDGVMTVFFLLVGLELKRECLIGELAGRHRMLQPVLAALGGMIIPVLVYLITIRGEVFYRAGWAIPAATDIAFALGVIGLLGSRIPKDIKILLTALAVLDDMGAIALIVIFYSQGLDAVWLLWAVCAIGALYILNRRSVASISPYLICGCIMWLGFLKGGLHPTLAGVVTALFIPLRHHPGNVAGTSPLYHLEHKLHKPVGFLVLPLFAFVNAGLSFDALSVADMTRPLTLAVLLGLCVGKPVGILGGLWLGHVTGLARIPSHIPRLCYAAMACFCGIGFTMSLFINDLAFSEAGLQNQAKLGVLCASFLAALCGVGLTWSIRPARPKF